MIERDAALGVDVFGQTAVTGISHDEVQLGGRSIRCRWIVGADGTNSRVRRWANLNLHSRGRLRYAFRRHYRIRPWRDRMEVYWRKPSQGYSNPVHTETLCL